ncbi:hypothetical protein HID58_037986 [Brassica napus]|uniref:C2H2-type domain-containing protein n=1 Tax=Brassica napus TaxID=3708 RepID=A0ABQ8BMZ4_BRANA|nr:hypothetical protein HID58_037986 [Brassica napus]
MEKGKSDERLMLYTCRVCGKGYRSSKAHEQHCKSWSHDLRVSQGTTSNGDVDVAIVTPLPRRFKNKDNEENDADMHKHHGFFVPNDEYLKDPEGFSLTSVLRFGLVS